MGQKFSLADALEKFSDSEIWSCFVKAETACRKKGWITDPFGESCIFLGKPPRGYRVLEARRSAAWDAVYKPFISKLKAGVLAATGILYPAKLNAQENPIPTTHWSFLKLSFPRDEAEGGGLRFVGIRVGLSSSNQPNEPDTAAVEQATPARPSEISKSWRWVPLALAIECVAARKAIVEKEAWEIIKTDIGRGALPAQGTDNHGIRTPFELHWVELTAKFLSQDQAARPLFNDPGDQLPAHESRGELHRLADFPSDSMLWFDRTKAAQNRLARTRTADNRADVSLPPKFLRDIVVDATRLNELYPATIDDNPKERLDGGGEEAPALRKGTIRAEKDCVEWLLVLMKGDSQPTKKRDDYKADAVQKFGVSDRAFLRCWGNAIRETGNTNWGKAGRKSKQRIDTPV